MEHSSQARKWRSSLIDYIRFIAIALMVFFHLSFDLKLFRFVEIDFINSTFWWTLPRIIVFLFLISMGMSFEITYEKKLHQRKFLRRLGKLALGAISITIFTYFAYRSRWIYFGTLHCIFVCSLAAIPFRNRPKTSLTLAVLILAPLLWGFQWPWPKFEHASLDYIPALPWFGVVLLGMALKHTRIHELPLPSNKIIRFFSRHSLVVYLLHQPILFGLVKIAYTMTH